MHGTTVSFSPIGWGCGIHRLHLCNEGPGYDTKQSDDEVPVMMGLWGMWSIPLLALIPGPIWPGMVAPDRALSMALIKLNCILMIN